MDDHTKPKPFMSWGKWGEYCLTCGENVCPIITRNCGYWSWSCPNCKSNLDCDFDEWD